MKKVDSTLRGPLAAEIEAALAASGRTARRRRARLPRHRPHDRRRRPARRRRAGAPDALRARSRLSRARGRPALLEAARRSARASHDADDATRTWRRSCAPSTIRRRCCGSARPASRRRSAPSIPGDARRRAGRGARGGPVLVVVGSANDDRARADRAAATGVPGGRSCRSTGATSSARAVIDALEWRRRVRAPSRRGRRATRRGSPRRSPRPPRWRPSAPPSRASSSPAATPPCTSRGGSARPACSSRTSSSRASSLGRLLGPRRFRVVTKAGGFGSPDALRRASAALAAGGRSRA